MSKILAILNQRAGTMIDYGPERMRDELAAALEGHGDRAEVKLVPPKEIGREIERAAKGDADTVIVGGGDGSVSCAVGALAGTGKTLGVLPFGTMNLLGRDLGMPAEPAAAMAAIADATPREIDLATIDGRLFHSLSGLGFFSQMARAREEVRGNWFGRFLGVGIAAARAMTRTAPFHLDVTVDGKHEQLEAIAVLITNNRFDAGWRRHQLDEGVLEMHVARSEGAFSKLRAGADLITGSWRDAKDLDVRSIVGRELTITRRRHHTWAATDGELRRENVPMRYGVKPRALRVLVAGPPTR